MHHSRRIGNVRNNHSLSCRLVDNQVDTWNIVIILPVLDDRLFNGVGMKDNMKCQRLLDDASHRVNTMVNNYANFKVKEKYIDDLISRIDHHMDNLNNYQNEDNLFEVSLDLNNNSLDIKVMGSKRAGAQVLSVLLGSDYETDKPFRFKEGEPQNYCTFLEYYGDDDSAVLTIWYNFSSTHCERVFVCNEMKEVPKYTYICK